VSPGPVGFPRLGAVTTRAALLAVATAVAGTSGWLAAPGPSPAPSVGSDTLVLSSDLRVRVRSGRSIELEIRAGQGEGYVEVARRACGSAAPAAAIEAWNGGATVEPGSFVRVPLAMLSDEYRSLVLLDLFPRDHREGADWIHVARSGTIPTYDEGLWQIAEWFTGRGDLFELLQAANATRSPEVWEGQRIRVPGTVLHPALCPGPRSDDGMLEFREDALGPYAGYRLQAGEALYSSVILRFTGRTTPEDVGALAQDLARRSDVPDITDIPINYLVKIPLDVLEPEFLPRDHPARREAEATRAEIEAELSRRPVSTTLGGLRGVVLILDPGHGGRDLGTIHNGVWEHDYVYDVACRVKATLENETAARVFPTLEDTETGCSPSTGDTLVANRQGRVRSTPPFQADEDGESSVAVNLRWYVANSVFRRAVREGTDPGRVVFVSLHADSRHPSLRGVMVYVPGARHRTRTVGHDSAEYARFREVRESPSIRFTRAQRIRAEAVSRRLAATIVQAFGREDLPVQPYKPVRSEVIRSGRRWLPAVLRGNAVPAAVLVEVLNLGNREDAALLSKAAARQRIAEALVDSLYAYFGEKRSRGASVAEGSR